VLRCSIRNIIRVIHCSERNYPYAEGEDYALLIPALLIVALVLLLARSRRRPGRSVSVNGLPTRDPVRLILLVVIALLLIGLVVNLVAPLGDYRLAW
jgi:hypothetical protein